MSGASDGARRAPGSRKPCFAVFRRATYNNRDITPPDNGESNGKENGKLNGNCGYRVVYVEVILGLYGGFLKLGVHFGDPHNKEYSILGSILGFPYLGL